MKTFYDNLVNVIITITSLFNFSVLYSLPSDSNDYYFGM